MSSWYLTGDGDEYCLALYERHYSCYDYKDGRIRKLFIGPGEKIVLRTWEADAMFVWRKFLNDSGQKGIYCSIFRNESQAQSSTLIQEADAIADEIWLDKRLYTYVNEKKIRSTNPGYCFQKAGWTKCGKSKTNKLIIFERIKK